MLVVDSKIVHTCGPRGVKLRKGRNEFDEAALSKPQRRFIDALARAKIVSVSGASDGGRAAEANAPAASADAAGSAPGASDDELGEHVPPVLDPALAGPEGAEASTLDAPAPPARTTRPHGRSNRSR